MFDLTFMISTSEARHDGDDAGGIAIMTDGKILQARRRPR